MDPVEDRAAKTTTVEPPREATLRETLRRPDLRRELLTGYGFIAIPIGLFLVFNIGAILYALYISFYDWGILGAGDFIGTENYRRLVGDTTFHTAVRRTLYYTVLVVPIQMAIGLTLAVAVNSKIRGQTFFRAAFYFPAIASSAAITVLFIFLLAPDGLFNDILSNLGLEPRTFANRGNWLGHSRSAMESVVAINAWTTSGTMMLFYLASLQTISDEVYEAAAIDGASGWQAFWRITMPLLKPGHYFVAVVSVIGALQMFDQAYIAGGAGGDPARSLLTMVLYLYNATIVRTEWGYAAAVGIVLFVIIFIITLVQRHFFGEASWGAE